MAAVIEPTSEQLDAINSLEDLFGWAHLEGEIVDLGTMAGSLLVLVGMLAPMIFPLVRSKSHCDLHYLASASPIHKPVAVATSVLHPCAAPVCVVVAGTCALDPALARLCS